MADELANVGPDMDKTSRAEWLASPILAHAIPCLKSHCDFQVTRVSWWWFVVSLACVVL